MRDLLMGAWGPPRQEMVERIAGPGEWDGDGDYKTAEEMAAEDSTAESHEALAATETWADFEVGQLVKGTVSVKTDKGVLVDVGGGRLARLSGHAERARLLEYDEELEFAVQSVDHFQGRLVLTLPDMDERMAGREPMTVRLEDLQPGEVVDGRVVGFVRGGRYGVWVDIGCKSGVEARAPSSQRKRMNVHLGQQVQVRLKFVDPLRNLISASLVDPSVQRFELGQSIRGTVRVKRKGGALVDVGTKRLAYLRGLSPESARLLEYGEELDFAIDGIDHARGSQLMLTLPNAEEHVAGREWNHVELEDFQVGSVVEGHVVNIKEEGVWVDVGCSEADARLLLPSSVRKNVQLGQKMQVRLDQVRVQKKIIAASLPDEAAPRVEGRKEPKGLEKAEAEKKQTGAPPLDDALKGFEVGQSVKGTVRVKSRMRVLADVGVEALALVSGPTAEVAQLLEYGEELDFVVEGVDTAEGLLTLTLPNMEEHVAGREPSNLEFTDLQVGAVMEGHVTQIKERVVMVDIGNSERDAWLPISSGEGSSFRQGQKVEVVLVRVDAEKGKILASRIDNTLKSFEKGQSLKGTLITKTRRGVLLDVGTPNLAYVDGLSGDCLQLLRYGEELECVVEGINFARSQLTLSLPNMNEVVAGRELRNIDIKDFQVGSIVEGYVCSINQYTVWVDVGFSERQARVCPKTLEEKRLVRLGQKIQVRLDKVDVEKKVFSASLVIGSRIAGETLLAEVPGGESA